MAASEIINRTPDPIVGDSFVWPSLFWSTPDSDFWNPGAKFANFWLQPCSSLLKKTKIKSKKHSKKDSALQPRFIDDFTKNQCIPTDILWTRFVLLIMLLLFLLVDIALLPGLPVVPLPVLLLLLFISLLLFLFVTILPTGEEALNFYNLCSTFFKSTKVPVHNLTLRKPFTQCKKSIIIIIIIYNNEQTENYEPGTE